MEIEPHQGVFKFLESVVSVKKNKISCQFYLRNYDKLQNRMITRFLNTKHWDSFGNTAVKRAVITSTLYRIIRFTDPTPNLILAVIAHWSYELKQLGYPLTPILRSIRNLSEHMVAPGLKASMSTLVGDVFNNSDFDFTPYRLHYH